MPTLDQFVAEAMPLSDEDRAKISRAGERNEDDDDPGQRYLELDCAGSYTRLATRTP